MNDPRPNSFRDPVYIHVAVWRRPSSPILSPLMMANSMVEYKPPEIGNNKSIAGILGNRINLNKWDRSVVGLREAHNSRPISRTASQAAEVGNSMLALLGSSIMFM